MPNLIKGAELSPDRKYRYALWRIWDETKRFVVFICLNPSTADETEDDATIRRCMGYAKSWGFGGIYMVNLFAFRAKEPSDMKAVDDPIGPENDYWLRKLSCAGLAVAGWGNDGAYRGRSKEVRELIPELYCLKQNKSGEPVHPLYQKASLTPTLMED